VEEEDDIPFPPPPLELQDHNNWDEEGIHQQEQQQEQRHETPCHSKESEDKTEEDGKEDIKTNDDNDKKPSVKFVATDSTPGLIANLSSLKHKSFDYLSESSYLQKSYSTSHLKEKLDLMKIERMSLRNDYEQNETFGSCVLSRLTDKYCLNKFRVDKLTNHCNEVDTISRLVVSLRMRLKHLLDEESEKRDRLQKIEDQEVNPEENGLHHQEIVDENVGGLTLHPQSSDNQVSEKRNKLSRQLSEAMDLKQLIDNRSHSLMDKYCSSHQRNHSSINQRQEGIKDSTTEKQVDQKNDDPSSCSDMSDFLEYVHNKSNIIMRIKEVEDQIDSIEKSLEM
jgi:hypothetical protein